MAYIKKMVMQGFKSFARKTEIPFENSMNVIVGPNGSGKSNVADALCFVLGRMSIKSIRAAKAANLLFSGNKNYKGSNEASVELIFDNRDMAFSLNTSEVSIKRIVRRNGLSIYKINNETKTRQELIELLAQAGIDPNGFNIVLQGDITSLVKIGAEERRKIIEEVAGISIYEMRKEKSIKELEKTDEKLKEVSAILKEKNTYLRNLEKDRQDALNYQKLEQLVKKCKATIITKTIKDREKEIWGLDKEIENHKKEIGKIKTSILEQNKTISDLEEKISKINKQIQQSSGEEQEILHKEVAELKAEISGLKARKENFESRISENQQKENSSKNKIKELEAEIELIKTKSPEINKQQEKLKEMEEKIEILEKKRREFYNIKSELSTLENKKEEQEKSIKELQKETEFIERNISQIFEEIKYEKSLEKSRNLANETEKNISKLKETQIELEKKLLELEKEQAIQEKNIERESKLKANIDKIETCPTCNTEITETHRKEVLDGCEIRITKANSIISSSKENREKLILEISKLKERNLIQEKKLNEIGIDILKIKSADEKKESLKRLFSRLEELKIQKEELTKKIIYLRKKFEELKNIEEEYDDTRIKIQDLAIPELDFDTDSVMKRKDIERIKNEIKTISRDTNDCEIELKKINNKLAENEKIERIKEKEEEILYERFNKFFSDKNELQDQQKGVETMIIGLQHEIRSQEDKINNLNIQKAQQSAQLETLAFDLKEFGDAEILSIPVEQAKIKLQETQIKLSGMGSINLKSLEVYDAVKEACEKIQEKMDTIMQEKDKIMKIIEEIDKKKRKTFIKTLDSVNELFTRNFTQLSKKGEVFLDLENKQDPFAGGLNIIVKVGRGKYFDIASLSGGEKTLVALSLIFAIQEHRPYCFYVFDEIDAALDKHNSELLAGLIKRYMLSGQYIVITHNDALISEATTLYGVSMQEGLSNVISLKI